MIIIPGYSLTEAADRDADVRHPLLIAGPNLLR
jgi:hypothetical protein